MTKIMVNVDKSKDYINLINETLIYNILDEISSVNGDHSNLRSGQFKFENIIFKINKTTKKINISNISSICTLKTVIFENEISDQNINIILNNRSFLSNINLHKFIFVNPNNIDIHIEDSVFNNTPLTNTNIFKCNIKHIGYGGFSMSKKLKHVDLSKQTDIIIDGNAFHSSIIQMLSLPPNSDKVCINKYAFTNCEHIVNILIDNLDIGKYNKHFESNETTHMSTKEYNIIPIFLIKNTDQISESLKTEILDILYCDTKNKDIPIVQFHIYLLNNIINDLTKIMHIF